MMFDYICIHILLNWLKYTQEGQLPTNYIKGDPKQTILLENLKCSKYKIWILRKLKLHQTIYMIRYTSLHNFDFENLKFSGALILLGLSFMNSNKFNITGKVAECITLPSCCLATAQNCLDCAIF